MRLVFSTLFIIFVPAIVQAKIITFKLPSTCNITNDTILIETLTVRKKTGKKKILSMSCDVKKKTCLWHQIRESDKSSIFNPNMTSIKLDRISLHPDGKKAEMNYRNVTYKIDLEANKFVESTAFSKARGGDEVYEGACKD